MARTTTTTAASHKPSRRNPAAAAAAWGIDPANPQADLEPAPVAQTSSEDQLRSYTVAEVAKLLRCHVQTVRDMIASKKLPHFKIGVEYRVRHVDLMAFTQPVT